MVTVVETDDSFVHVERINENPQPVPEASTQFSSHAASSMTAMAQRLTHLEETDMAHSANGQESTQSAEIHEEEQSSTKRGQRPPRAAAHMVSGANVETSHLHSTGTYELG